LRDSGDHPAIRTVEDPLLKWTDAAWLRTLQLITQIAEETDFWDYCTTGSLGSFVPLIAIEEDGV